MDAAGAVVTDVTFQLLDGSTYRCNGSGCDALRVSAPDAQGAARSTPAAASCPRSSGGLIGDRSVAITGSFLTPPPAMSAATLHRDTNAR